MGFISHQWPGITPFNVMRLPAHWWAYYIRAAQQVIEQSKPKG